MDPDFPALNIPLLFRVPSRVCLEEQVWQTNAVFCRCDVATRQRGLSSAKLTVSDRPKAERLSPRPMKVVSRRISASRVVASRAAAACKQHHVKPTREARWAPPTPPSPFHLLSPSLKLTNERRARSRPGCCSGRVSGIEDGVILLRHLLSIRMRPPAVSPNGSRSLSHHPRRALALRCE